MTFDQLIKFFGSVKTASERIGVSRAALAQWKAARAIPPLRQHQIQNISQGKLVARHRAPRRRAKSGESIGT